MSNTPETNQDGILKQRIYEEFSVFLAGNGLSEEQYSRLMDDRKDSVELIMRLIKADRSTHERKARIKEAQYQYYNLPDTEPEREKWTNERIEQLQAKTDHKEVR